MKQIMIAALCAAALGTSAETTNTVDHTARVVVTAARIISPSEQSGSSLSVLTGKTIKQAGYPDTLQALQSLPGISVVQDGGPGQRSSIFLRGAKGNATKVLIDGIPINDNSAFGGADLSQFPAELIEKIEVLRGPQGVIHGADAMAGVINIVTKKGKGTPTLFLNGEAGSYNTWKTSIGAAGETNGLSYYAFAEKFHTAGISAYNKRHEAKEDDAFDRETIYTKLGVTPTENTFINFIIQRQDSTVEFDTGMAPFVIENGAETDQEQQFLSAEFGARLWDEQLISKLTFSLFDQMRDTADPAWGDRDYELQTYRLDWQNNLLLERQEILIGADFEYSEADTSSLANKENMDILGLYAEDRITLLDNWFATLGIRHSEHSDYKGETTYHADMAYIIPETETKLRAAYGTGFRSPTLSELYDNSWGNANPDLQPETSEGWEIGFDQPLTEQTTIGLTYFQTDYEDVITYVGWAIPNENINKASTTGFEAYLNTKVQDNLTLHGTYTYQDNDDHSAGNGFELRRPENQVNVTINYAPTEKWNINLNGTYVGSTLDVGDKKLTSYTLVNLATSYQLTERLKLFGRVNNLLDEEYETVYGYSTARLGAYGGLSLSF